MSNENRVHHPIETDEMERRWAAIRGAMERDGIDVLVMQNNNDFMGGYVKYFTDIPATNGYPCTVIFPRDDEMTVIIQTRFDHCEDIPKGNNGYRRGVKRVYGSPYFTSAYYTNEYDAAQADIALTPYQGKTVGIVGRGTFPVSMLDHLTKNSLRNTRIVDASNLVDMIKAIKSETELKYITATAAAQDAAIGLVMKAIKPGMREIEVEAMAEQYMLSHGSEQGLYLCSSNKYGEEAVYWGNRHLQNRMLGKGDFFTLLIECNGPGGFYTEISRTCYFGKVPNQIKEEFEILLEARKLTLSLLLPGATCKGIWDKYNQFLTKHARPNEERLYCHGQGYDLVERPLVRRDEPMEIMSGMNLACHPTFVTNGAFNTICDNYIVGPAGVGGRLHQYPEMIVEID